MLFFPVRGNFCSKLPTYHCLRKKTVPFFFSPSGLAPFSAATAPPLPIPTAAFHAGSRRCEPWPVQALPPTGGLPLGPRAGKRPPPRAGLPSPSWARGRCEPPPQHACLHRGQASWPRADEPPCYPVSLRLSSGAALPCYARAWAPLRPASSAPPEHGPCSTAHPALLRTSVGATLPYSPTPLRPSAGATPPCSAWAWSPSSTAACDDCGSRKLRHPDGKKLSGGGWKGEEVTGRKN